MFPPIRAKKNAAASLCRCFDGNGRAFVGEHFFQVGIVRLAGGEGFLIMPARELRQRRRLAQINHGVTLSHKGQRVAAETALRKALQLDNTYAPAHNNLAVIYLSQTPSLPQLARWHYQKALATGQPHNPELEKMLADKGAPVASEAPVQ